MEPMEAASLEATIRAEAIVMVVDAVEGSLVMDVRLDGDEKLNKAGRRGALV